MRTSRKAYGFEHANTDLHLNRVPKSHFTDRDGRRHALKVADFGLRRLLSVQLVAATQRYGAVASYGSACSAKSAIKHFAVFLLAQPVTYKNILDIDLATRKRYLDHLRRKVRKGLAHSTARRTFGLVQHILRDGFASENAYFETVTCSFRGAALHSNHREVIDPSVLKAILRAAKHDADAIMQRFASRDTVSVSSDLGKAIAYVSSHWGGIVSPDKQIDGKPHSQTWAKLASRAGGTELVAQHLHATLESLLPFLILLTYHTAGNIESIAGMSRTCKAPDPLLNGSYTITWWKGRSNAEQRVSRSANHRFSAPALIDSVLRLTAPLVTKAPAACRSQLFICYQRNHIGPLRRHVGKLNNFLLRHKIICADGKPVRLTLAMLRPTVLNEVYRRTGSLYHVYKLANHKNVLTSLKYLRDRVVGDSLDLVIVRSQGRMFTFASRRKRKIEKPAVKNVIEPTNAADALARGVSNDCRDIFSGPLTQVRDSKQCSAWFWPLNDPNLIVPDDPQYAARLLQLESRLLEAREEMNSKRFERILKPAFDLVTTILQTMSAETTTHAKQLVRCLTPIPSLCDE